MFSLVQTVRYYQSRFIFLFAWRRFGVDFVSLILQHARHFLSLEREKCVRFCSSAMMICWEKKFEEKRSKKQSKDEIVLSETTRARLSLSSLSLELWNLSKRRERERDRCACRERRDFDRTEGVQNCPRKISIISRAHALRSLTLSLFIISGFKTAFISSFASDSEVVCFRARFSRTIHSPYS